VFCLIDETIPRTNRYTRFDPGTNLLHPSKALFLKPPSKLAAFVLHFFSALGLTENTIHPQTGVILETNNLTILNFLLKHSGPMNEKSLVQTLMCTQVRSVGYC